MNAQLQKWAETIDGLALRERLLIVVSAIALLFLLVDTLVYQPAGQRQQKLKESIENLQREFTVLQVEATTLRTDGESNPENIRKDRIESLEAEERRLNDVINEQLGLVMDPKDAHKILKDILRRDSSVKLLSLQTEVIGLTSNAAAVRNDAAFQLPGINRYQMTLRLQGNYLAILRFLQTLEALPWALLWEQLDLKVVEHPDTEVTLVIYTLGAYGEGS